MPVETSAIQRVGIVGRGFSGTAAAIALIEATPGPLHLVLIDREPTLAGGVAYGKAFAGELLNVRARDITVFPEKPGDFGHWLAARDGGMVPDLAHGQQFAPRAVFGDYVREALGKVLTEHPDVTVEMHDGVVLSVEALEPGFRISFGGAAPIAVDALVLATGYGCEGELRRFGYCPFTGLTPERVDAAKTIALIGSGLTMADVLLRLRRGGYRGEIEIISRHGLAPLRHTREAALPIAWSKLYPGPTPPLVTLFRRVRYQARRAAQRDDPWQGVINGLRPLTQAIWRGFSDADRKRFLRHVRTYWDIHRHRLPPEQFDAMQAELALDRTRLRAGRVLSIDGQGSGDIALRWRGDKDVSHLRADLMVDCSGHRPNLDEPIFRSLRGSGLVEVDGLGLGLVVDSQGHLLRDGEAVPGLYALGPLGQGSLFEITAIPEIAAQARKAAAAMVEEWGDGVGYSESDARVAHPHP